MQNRLASNSELVKRLRRGVDTLLASRHPNVVEILEFGRSGRTLFLAMEWLDGESLDDVLRCTETLPVEEVDAIIRGVGDGLAYLHAKGIAHGRLTPASVVVTNDLQIRLVDLMPLPSVTRSDNRSQDIFSLACLTYQLLTGRHPYNSNTAEEAMQAGLVAKRIDALSDTRWNALARALALDPASRPDSVDEFLREFDVPEIGRQFDTRPLAEIDESPDAQRVGNVFETRGESIVDPDPDVGETEARPSGFSKDDDTEIDVWPATEIVLPINSTRRAVPAPQSKRNSLAWLIAISGVAAIGVLGWSTLGRLPTPEQATVAVGIADGDAVPEQAAVAGTTADEDAVPEQAAVAVGVADEDAVADDIAERSTGAGTTSAVAEVPDAAAVAADEAPPPATPETGLSPAPRTGATEAPDEPSPLPEAEPEPAVLQWPVSPVSFSEGAVYARIEVRRTGDLTMPAEFVWWTVPLDAIADEDYLDLGQRTERFAPQEDTLTLLVPLVNDSLPEATKRFEIRLQSDDIAIGNDGGGSSLRIEIVDDD